MSDVVLSMNSVFKKFRKGELFDSLRDLIPAITGKMFRSSDGPLEKKEFWALSDVSFDVYRGEAFGIIGQNGAGKSTILKLLSGIMKPTTGEMKVDGRLSALIEVGAGFHPDLTGRENIYLNGTILGMTRREVKSKFDAIVDFSGLEEFIETPVKRYSSGMYARLGFSVAAYVDPDILIVDEVLSVGDYLFQEKCASRMKTVIESGATVIFVSHNLRAVADLCQRSLLLDHGKVITIGDTSDTIKKYMSLATSDRSTAKDQDVTITSVSLRNKDGETVRFESGERAWIDIEVVANRRCEKIAIVLDIKDDRFYNVFDTSSERLGHGNVTLEKGERLRITFELDIHLAYGSFHIGATVYRYDVQKALDCWFPATTIYVSNDMGVRGAVNCRPKIVAQEIIRGTGQSETS